MISLSVLSVRGLAELCTRISDCSTAATSMEQVAGRAIAVLRNAFTGDDGRSDIVLARLFVTSSTTALPAELRDRARAQCLQDGTGTGTGRNLLLLATEGDLPAWCDRRRSRAHEVLTLGDPAHLGSMPMVAALVSHLGLDVDGFLRGNHSTENELGVFFVREALGDPAIPDQHFVREHGVRAVLGFGDVLPGGEVFTVVVFTRSPVADEVAAMFRTLAVAAKLAMLNALELPLLDGQQPRPADPLALADARIRSLEQMVTVQQQAVVAQTERLEVTLADAIEARAVAEREVETVAVLREVSMLLSRQLDIDELVQQATDAATRVTGAQLGAFFHHSGRDGDGQLYALSGTARPTVEPIPSTRRARVLPPAVEDGLVLRSDDVAADPSYDGMEPFPGLPQVSVRSYLATPVVSPSGEVLGALLFGHADVGVFDDRAERLAVGIAAQVSISLDNARLYQQERRTALALQQSLLPQDVEQRAGLTIGYEYSPGGGGLDVGGDWFDVIALPGGRTALVIGDVMGRGIRAAAIMGQLRTAVRAYAVSDLPPDVLMSRLNQIVLDMDDDLIATCTYAVLDPLRGSLTLGSAGHLPAAVMRGGGSVELVEDELGPPLGVDGGIYLETEVAFPVGDRLLLFTDGLVEHRGRSLGEGLEQLTSRLTSLEGPPDLMCAHLLKSMLDEVDQDDDVSMVMVANSGLSRSEHVVADYPPDASAAAQARAFVAGTLVAWGDAAFVDDVVLAVNELFINAVAHARTPLQVSLRRLPDTLVAEVTDHVVVMPKRVHAAPYDEGHRGLNIVSTLAVRWGTRLSREGKVVWAEFGPMPEGAASTLGRAGA